MRASFAARLIGTGLFVGYSPWASGTLGTAVGLLLFAIPAASEPWLLLPLAGGLFLAGAWASAQLAAEVGHQLTESARRAKATFQAKSPAAHADPSIVVVDEIVGVWVTMAFLPVTWVTVTAAFLVFRFFDIVKPYPVAEFEKLPGGWGIMGDDVMAGIYACVTLHIARFVLHLVTGIT